VNSERAPIVAAGDCGFDRKTVSQRTAPIAVVIPTYGRGARVAATLNAIARCDPRPEEIWLHVDQAAAFPREGFARSFPDVRVVCSATRLGPGGGRHACLQKVGAPLAVCFDDDSYPCDTDFFESVSTLFEKLPRAAVIGASIWRRRQMEVPRSATLVRKPSFTGCGAAMRLSAYRDVSGYIPRPVAYGVEESDLSLQFFAKGYEVYESGELRVFHDTELQHHGRPEITECVVANVALLAFLRYPILLWPWGLLQLASTIGYCLRNGRRQGVLRGLLRIPLDCFTYRGYRTVYPFNKVRAFLMWRRSFRS